VAALFRFIEVDQVVARLLGPAAWRLKVLFGKTVTAVGKERSTCCQYNRGADVAVFVSQYSEMLSTT
jgi:hypothetical protein